MQCSQSVWLYLKKIPSDYNTSVPILNDNILNFNSTLTLHLMHNSQTHSLATDIPHRLHQPCVTWARCLLYRKYCGLLEIPFHLRMMEEWTMGGWMISTPILSQEGELMDESKESCINPTHMSICVSLYLFKYFILCSEYTIFQSKKGGLGV